MKKLGNKGATLMEMLVGMTMFTIILAGLFPLLSSVFRAQQYNYEGTANSQTERFIINAISDEIRNATAITSAGAGSLIYTKNLEAAARSITLVANTLVFTDTNGVQTKYGQGRVQNIIFSQDAVIKRKITVTMTLNNPSVVGSPTNTATTIIYTLTDI